MSLTRVSIPNKIGAERTHVFHLRSVLTAGSGSEHVRSEEETLPASERGGRGVELERGKREVLHRQLVGSGQSEREARVLQVCDAGSRLRRQRKRRDWRHHREPAVPRRRSDIHGPVDHGERYSRRGDRRVHSLYQASPE